MPTLDPIAQKLQQLRDTVDFNKNLEVFNAANRNADLYDVVSHRYQLGPCLTEAEVSAFETLHKMSLPADYRAFLLQIGDGGAGPYYGLYSLARALQTAQHKAATLHDVLSLPFPHSAAYQRPPKQDAAAVATFLRDVKDPTQIQGTLPLADFGCGIDVVLVVTGAVSGTLWLDDRPSENGVWPLYAVNGAVDFSGELFLDADEDEDTIGLCSFAQWYEAWLDERITIHADYQRGAWSPDWTEARRDPNANAHSLLFQGDADD